MSFPSLRLSLSLPCSLPRHDISLSLHLSVFLYSFRPFLKSPLSPFSLLSALSCHPAGCRRGKTETYVSESELLKCSAPQPRVTSTMRLLKSQVDQVDSPPSAGLTTNQYESRLMHSHSRHMRGSRVPTGRGIFDDLFHFEEFK